MDRPMDEPFSSFSSAFPVFYLRNESSYLFRDGVVKSSDQVPRIEPFNESMGG